MGKKIIFWSISVLILAGLLIVSFFAALCLGPAGIPAGKVIPLLFSDGHNIERSIIFDIRLPRIILAIIVGGALSVSGVIFQSLFRNPLVEPYTLGISGGAALFVSVCIAFGLNVFLPLAGFIGAVICVLIAYFIGTKSGSMLLPGVMISFVSSSLVMFIMAVSGNQELHNIIFWIMGGLGETNTGVIRMGSILILFGVIASIFFSRSLNALSLGDEEAMHLGIDIYKTKKILFILGSFLSGCSVSVSGIIGFVGLVIPQFIRMFVGGDHRILIVSSFLAGSIFLLICDTLARTIIVPLELPVGVITGIIGGSVFIYFLIKRKGRCLR